MTENIGTGGAEYNTVIPALADNADITAALRLYHYGADTTNPGALAGDGSEDFIAGHLKTLENTKLGTSPTVLTASDDLDDKLTTGFYSQPNATPTGSTYPVAFAGAMTVIASGTDVFQTYQVIGGTASDKNMWIRYSRDTGSTWQPWVKLTNSDNLSALLASYDTTAVANNKFLQSGAGQDADLIYLSIADANTRQYVVENAQTSDYTLALTDVNKVIAMSNANTTTVTIPLSSSVAFQTGTLVNVFWAGVGSVRVAGAVGVTLRPYGDGTGDTIELSEQYTEISLRYRGSDEWVASGNFVEV